MNIALSPTANKNVKSEEAFYPAHIECRNGIVTDAGNWLKRNGYAQKWDVTVDRPVAGLIPRSTGYAITDNGRIYKLGSTISYLSGATAEGMARPDWAEFDDKIIICAGGKPIKIYGGATSLLGGSPPDANFVARIGGYTCLAAKGGTTWYYSTINNPEDAYSSNTVKKDGTIMNMKGLNERLYFFKTTNIEQWSLLGTMPFARIESALIEKGCGASDSVVKANLSLYWLGEDSRFYRLVGNSPQTISADYQKEIFDLAIKSDIYGIDYPMENCIRWFAPSGGRCFKWDYKHEFMSEDNEWYSGQWQALRHNSYMELGGKAYFGSSHMDGLVHEWSDDYLDDNGNPIRVFRDFRVKGSDSGRACKWRIDKWRFKRGVATASVTSPALAYRYNINEQGWSHVSTIGLGQIGDNDPWVWDKSVLGIGEEIRFQVWETDAVEFLLTDMELDVQELER